MITKRKKQNLNYFNSVILCIHLEFYISNFSTCGDIWKSLCIGEGNGNPLQCSCLENPRDGGAWWLPSVGSHKVRHDWSNLAAAARLKVWSMCTQNGWEQSSAFPSVSEKRWKTKQMQNYVWKYSERRLGKFQMVISISSLEVFCWELKALKWRWVRYLRRVKKKWNHCGV